MKKTNELDVRGTLVRVIKIGGEDYVCLTDMAKLRSDDAQQTISNWMRNRMTLEYLGLWEELYNPDFNPLGFEGFSFYLTVVTSLPNHFSEISASLPSFFISESRFWTSSRRA